MKLAIQQHVGGGEFFGELRRIGRAQARDQRRHCRIRRNEIGEDRQQVIAHILDRTLADGEVDDGEEFAARSGVGDEGLAVRIGDEGRPWHGIVGVAAENDVDAANAACEFQIDVHAVVRQQQHRIDLVVLAQLVDELLQRGFADAEGPIGREAPGMGDRDVGHRLADDAEAAAAGFLDGRRLEHPPGGGVERGGVVERGLVGEKDVLRQELAVEAADIAPQRLFAVGEFPVSGHRLDAEQVGDRDHVGARRRGGKAAALPQVAAVEQEAIAGAGVGAQPVDQGLPVGEAAHGAVATGGVGEIQIGKGVGVAA